MHSTHTLLHCQLISHGSLWRWFFPITVTVKWSMSVRPLFPQIWQPPFRQNTARCWRKVIRDDAFQCLAEGKTHKSFNRWWLIAKCPLSAIWRKASRERGPRVSITITSIMDAGRIRAGEQLYLVSASRATETVFRVWIINEAKLVPSLPLLDGHQVRTVAPFNRESFGHRLCHCGNLAFVSGQVEGGRINLLPLGSVWTVSEYGYAEMVWLYGFPNEGDTRNFPWPLFILI